MIFWLRHKPKRRRQRNRILDPKGSPIGRHGLRRLRRRFLYRTSPNWSESPLALTTSSKQNTHKGGRQGSRESEAGEVSKGVFEKDSKLHKSLGITLLISADTSCRTHCLTRPSGVVRREFDASEASEASEDAYLASDSGYDLWE